ncbi:ABC transporter ATP-binding protein [Psychrobacillus lasiicapitis]|uniref:Carnitine transport ATP-binding protein OpuCA n=1 Tax=Psychrobacillus lasiicapitis TaxID=1636719 RepID=A0A544T1K9_9BACI|nr:ABC transporter ATP-binding protein [Psychrobacillus lasiicapitis]TQR11334.1 ABC transporter ATP-binding protein [Psychrobacillus lasiicapitis]GGA41394.1 spermidine/putrescine ABC transporter ATP-binding protein [Psychrobacillus lasiicapitis]
MSYVVIEGLHKTYGTNAVLANIDMTIEEGEFVTLLGPSGCGKSTILRIIAGLTDPTSGVVKIEGKNMSNIQPKNREVGMVFQSYALFPNMTVKENVAFGLKMKKMNESEIEQKVKDALAIVHLSDKEHAFPHELSGGQQQRVALARALIVRPKVLLLDEPLSALDAQIRKKLQADLRSIQTELGMTMVLVTHDQEEAMAVSDKIFVMNKGIIAQEGTPTEIYTKPESEFVANFIGHYNVFTREELEQMIGKKLSGEREKFAIRPEAIHLKASEGDYRFKGTAKEAMMSGNVIRTVFQVGDRSFAVEQLHERQASLVLGNAYECYVSQEDVVALL